jgi:hypothetical protein
MNTDPSTDDISERAYALWQQRGRPEGQESELWLEAEQELKRSAQHSPGAEASTPAVISAPTEKKGRAQRRDLAGAQATPPENRAAARLPKPGLAL